MPTIDEDLAVVSAAMCSPDAEQWRSLARIRAALANLDQAKREAYIEARGARRVLTEKALCDLRQMRIWMTDEEAIEQVIAKYTKGGADGGSPEPVGLESEPR